MATQIFVWFEGGDFPIAGDTPDPISHTRPAFEVQSFSKEVDNPASLGGASGGAGQGKAKFAELTLLKKVDSASAALFKACASGAHFPKARLAVRSGANVFLLYTLSLVFVDRVRTVGNQGELPLEEVALAYAGEQISFAATKPDGTLAPPTQAGWNQVTNSPDPG
jgi:type VI secretion system secreted protein Hcp